MRWQVARLQDEFRRARVEGILRVHGQVDAVTARASSSGHANEKSDLTRQSDDRKFRPTGGRPASSPNDNLLPGRRLTLRRIRYGRQVSPAVPWHRKPINLFDASYF